MPDNHPPDPQAVNYNGQGAPMGDHGITAHDISSLVTPEADGDQPSAVPETTEPAGEVPSDPVISVPGVGDMKVSEFMALREQAQAAEKYRSELDEYESAVDEIKTERQRLAQAARLQQFMDQHPQARGRIMQALQEIVSDPSALTDPSGKNPTDIPEPVKQQLEEVTAFVREQKVQAAERDVNSIFDGYKTQFPDIVTDQFRDKVIDRVTELAKQNPAIRDTLDKPMLEAIIAKEILSSGIPAAKEQGRQELADALKHLPKGAQVVSGLGTRSPAVEPPRDPRTMTRQQLIQETADSLYSGNME